MSDAWYYVHEGQEIGPVTSRQLKQLAASGSLRPADEVRREGMASTVPAGKIKNLFPVAAAGWLYRKDGQQLGPVAAGELKRLAASGGLRPTEEVRKESMSSWVPASSVKGLFPPCAEKQAPPSIPTPEAYGPAPDPASPPKEEPAEEYALAELVPGAGEQKETSKPSEEVPAVCDRCGDSLRQVLLKREPTDKKLCLTCQPPNGTCPLCRKKLRTPTARQCMHCSASWHRKVGEAEPVFTSAAPRPATAASGPTSGSQTAPPQKETLGQKAADFVVAAVVDAILSNL